MPGGIDGQSHNFRGVPDCMSWDHPRNVQFCDLVDKSMRIPASLEHALMWRFPDLNRKVIYKMPQLNRVTLGKHKAASDIWGRREPWTRANPAAASVASTSRAPTPEKVFFGKRTGALFFLSCLMQRKCKILKGGVKERRQALFLGKRNTCRKPTALQSLLARHRNLCITHSSTRKAARSLDLTRYAGFLEEYRSAGAPFQ